jgi:hypothetical protein
MHPIIERILNDYPSFTGKIKLNQPNFVKWNKLNSNSNIENSEEIIQFSDSESNFSNEEIHGRKKRKTRKIKKIFLS